MRAWPGEVLAERASHVASEATAARPGSWSRLGQTVHRAGPAHLGRCRQWLPRPASTLADRLRVRDSAGAEDTGPAAGSGGQESVWGRLSESAAADEGRTREVRAAEAALLSLGKQQGFGSRTPGSRWGTRRRTAGPCARRGAGATAACTRKRPGSRRGGWRE